ncbi:uncharacterized protein LOC117304802 [Asterias rubens]|uniref:uncharacterized protein LOC117304802 n=1 Tax=Asterias rubens TaxID=7604 RepID=UPI001455D3CB|nr:uncharacterized protein LOC117304802 [Asterias rubens]
MERQTETILSVVDQQVQYCVNDDTDALMTLVDPEITIVMDGYPLLSGFEGAKVMFEALPETASHIENTYKDVVPMDEDANYVYVTLHFDFFNESGVNYKDGSGLFLLKKTADGYKFYIMAISAHDQPSS